MRARSAHGGARDEPATAARYDALKQMLLERRQTILKDVQDRIRAARAQGSPDGRDAGTQPDDADIQVEIEFALMQMKAETLKKITTALGRLSDGTYGFCCECGEEIARARLYAIPFALRCTECEATRDVAPGRLRHGFTDDGWRAVW